ncbi:MAG: sulfatase, partial [Candidatus Marinimicrobia bacterium]|nr:sulfatase [Candidatus Neomarinimicrobiota bacterium]
IYIRNYMPHRSYIREAIIFSDRKRSFSELWRVRTAGNLPEAGRKMFESKPMYELYDLKNDPDELHNLAASDEHTARAEDMHESLQEWILQSRDTGFLHEAEMMLRSKDSNPYEMAHDPSQYNLEKILSSAETVGDTTLSLDVLQANLTDSDSGMRFWAAEAILGRLDEVESLIPELTDTLSDESPSVRIVAAETLCHLDQTDEALKILASDLQSQLHPTVVLQAASALREIGEKAAPLLPVVNKVRKENSGDVWGRYKSWMYPMFIGFALDQVVLNCGGDLPYEVQA